MAKDEPSDDDWVKLRREMVNCERPIHNMPNLKDNLFVPLGCLATVGALAIGLWGFRKGRTKLSQHMMQIRIIAQGVTITALIASVLSAGKSIK